MQDIGDFYESEKSYLKVYSDTAFKKKFGNLYSLLAQSDALVADYSSVGLEYLVLNRPIGYVITDMSEYTNTRGFSFENPYDYMPGEKIVTKEQFYGFLRDVQNGIDPFLEARTIARDQVHAFQDGNYSKRVLDFAGIRI